MGAWDVGPFDNDHAADFGGDLDDAPAHERAGLIRRALLAAIDEDDYLDSDVGALAVAAAALVAAGMPGGEGFASPPYGPKAPIPRLPAELIPLAIRAIDRVLADKSELRSLWGAGPDQPWDASMHRLRSALADPEGQVAIFEVGR